MIYEIKYKFEVGSGVCLWSSNDAANEKYDCAIDHCELPLSENTKKWLNYLIAWYDLSLDWDNAPQISDFWTDVETSQFTAAAVRGLQLLASELPSDAFDLINEVNT